MNKIGKSFAAGVVLACVISLFAVLQGCKSGKEIVGPDYSGVSDNERYDAIVKTYTDWNTVSLNGKASLKAGARLNSSVQIKMVKDEMIYVSVRPMLGIEIARLYLKKDSVVFIDKYNKLYIEEDLTALTSRLPFTLSTIQNLLLNRTFLLDGTTLSAKTKNQVKMYSDNDGSMIITPKEQMPGFVYSFIADSLNRVTNLQVVQLSNNKTYNTEYADFYNKSAFPMAEFVGLETVIGNKNVVLNFNLNASGAKWNEPVDTDIEIGKKYRKTTLSTYMKLFRKR